MAVPIKLDTNSQQAGLGSQAIVGWSLVYKTVHFWEWCIFLVIASIQWHCPPAWRNLFNILKILLAINSLSFCLTGIVFISPSFLKDVSTKYKDRIPGQCVFFPHHFEDAARWFLASLLLRRNQLIAGNYSSRCNLFFLLADSKISLCLSFLANEIRNHTLPYQKKTLAQERWDVRRLQVNECVGEEEFSPFTS